MDRVFRGSSALTGNYKPVEISQGITISCVRPTTAAAERTSGSRLQLGAKHILAHMHALASMPPACSRTRRAAHRAAHASRCKMARSAAKLEGTAGGGTACLIKGLPGRAVPETFLATSHEYTRIYDYGNAKSVAAWASVFNMLSSSPIIRVGGASQDKMLQAPGEEVWAALKRLQSQTNCRFIFGLPLWQSNAVTLSRQIINATQKHFGKTVLGYELGNEPEFWPTGLGGYNTTTGQWQEGFEAYAAHFHAVATALNPCSLPGGKRMLSGPGWGNVNTQPINWMADVLWAGKGCYLGEASVHYYPYIDNATVTAPQLLAEELQQFGLSKFRDYQRVAASASLQLRVSETNSLYGGGRPALSDTMTGTLWVADALFEFALAGAAGFHLHFGVGGAPDGSLGQPNTGVQTNFYYETAGGARREFKELAALQINPAALPAPVPWPSIHVPWYGYLFWTMAAAGAYGKTADTSFVPVTRDSGRRVQPASSNCTANIKVWALKSKSDASVRFTLHFMIDAAY
ncbi:hypothetical protein OEZ86_012072 [Tetradesmus obliquus]|nr:hypothetical protein OEZ86_012072 [Tetradesmus obliquus]